MGFVMPLKGCGLPRFIMPFEGVLSASERRRSIAEGYPRTRSELG